VVVVLDPQFTLWPALRQASTETEL